MLTQQPVSLAAETAQGFTVSCKVTAGKTRPQAGTAGLPHSWQLRPSNWNPIHHCLLSYESPRSELQAWQFPESHGWRSAGPFVLWPLQEMGLVLTFVPKQESRLGGKTPNLY